MSFLADFSNLKPLCDAPSQSNGMPPYLVLTLQTMWSLFQLSIKISLGVISRIFPSKFQLIHLISVSGNCIPLIFKICQTVVGISMICQFHGISPYLQCSCKSYIPKYFNRLCYLFFSCPSRCRWMGREVMMSETQTMESQLTDSAWFIWFLDGWVLAHSYHGICLLLSALIGIINGELLNVVELCQMLMSHFVSTYSK